MIEKNTSGFLQIKTHIFLEGLHLSHPDLNPNSPPASDYSPDFHCIDVLLPLELWYVISVCVCMPRMPFVY